MRDFSGDRKRNDRQNTQEFDRDVQVLICIAEAEAQENLKNNEASMSDEKCWKTVKQVAGLGQGVIDGKILWKRD